MSLSSSTAPNPQPFVSRNVAIAGGVVALHVVALWAFQTGLLQRAVEMVVPVTLMSEFIEPPKPVAPPPPPPPPPPKPLKTPVPRAPAPAPAPQPIAIADPTPAPNAPTGVIAPPMPLPPITAPVVQAPPAPPAPPKVELPSSDASYLQNPKPSYPSMSKRLGEQGKVIARVLVGADGVPQKVEVKKTSGFDRLDQAAMEYVMKCRYVPGKVGGVAQAMWYDAPVNFVLN